MGFLDWLRQRNEGAELKALSKKYAHDLIGSPGAAIRHYRKISEGRNGKDCDPDRDTPKTKARPTPSWER